ncbi:MAG: DUF2795 domain-containing protein [Nitrososphaera sp.]|jgi:hypothetical protein
MSSDEREHPEQIPSRANEGLTSKAVSEQGGIEGMRKEVDVKSYPKAAAVGQLLKDLQFPTSKQQILDYANRARPQSEEILSALQRIQDRQYSNVADVAEAAGLVRQ